MNTRTIVAGMLIALAAVLATSAAAQYTYFPSGDEEDGKFLIISGQGRETFANKPVLAWCVAPSSMDRFKVGIFDGDSGLDDDGNANWQGGNWDQGGVDPLAGLEFRVYADKNATGSKQFPKGTYMGNDMPNNGWFDIEIDCDPDALSPDGTEYRYFLEISTTDPDNDDASAFKIRCEGQVSLVPGEFAIMGCFFTYPDLAIIVPDYPDLSTRRYSGMWEFNVLVPQNRRISSSGTETSTCATTTGSWWTTTTSTRSASRPLRATVPRCPRASPRPASRRRPAR